MKILAVTNLCPMPDQPQRGLYNVQLFEAIRKRLQTTGRKEERGTDVTACCLVAEWRPWRWATIREWPVAGSRWPVSEYMPVFYLPLVGRSVSWITYKWSLRKLKKEIGEADAVLVPWLYPDGVAVTELAHEVGVPAWIMGLGSDTFHLRSPLRRKAILNACKKAKGVICVAKRLAARLQEAGVDPDKLDVIPNGVDSKLFRYRAKQEAFEMLDAGCSIQDSKRISSILTTDNQQPTTKLALFVGNLVHVKGVDILLKAWEELNHGGTEARIRELQESKYRGNDAAIPVTLRGEDVEVVGGSSIEHQALQLVIIGDGKMRKKLERMAEKLGIADSVAFLGARPHEEVALWMNVADCLCLPSRSEGMPNVVLEALASGLPVVANDVGACAEMLEDEPSCRVVALSSTDAGCRMQDAGCESPEVSEAVKIVAALTEVMDQDVDRAAMAQRNADKYSWDSMANETLKLMDKSN